MAAQIVEAAHHFVLAAHDERALADHVHGEIVAGIGHVRDVAGDLPVVAEDMLLLKVQQGGAMVGPAWKTAAIPIVGDRHIASMWVHEKALKLLNVHSIYDYFAINCNSLWKMRRFRDGC